MKTQLILITLVSAFSFQPAALFGQGSLTPPGAPAPTMKTLAQIEPRTDVLQLSGDATHIFLITNSGSYYLTTNIVGVSGKSGIGIAANGVTLDLNGFAVMGVSGSANGIHIPYSQTNVVVRNGNVSGWAGDGVFAANDFDVNVAFEKLTISANGLSGIASNGRALIDGCLAQNNGGGGFILNSGGEISHCSVTSGSSYGIFAELSAVRDCQVSSVDGYGIYALASSVMNCYVSSCVQSGIYVNSPGCQITGNSCFANNSSASTNDAGILLNDSSNRVENNHVFASGYAGIKVNTFYVNNVVIKNSVAGNGANDYIGLTGNDFGPISTAALASSPWANIAH